MAHEGLWRQLVELDPGETAERADCQYLSDSGRYVLTMLNSEYEVYPGNGGIFVVGEGSPPKVAGFIEQLCILAYLIGAKDIPAANKLVKAESLPGGQFFFRGPHLLPTEKLKNAFGDDPEGLIRASERFGGEKCEFGDASIKLNALPRIPLTFVIWRGDDEFDARASVLFDKTAADHIPLDALWATVNLTVKTLLQASGASH